MFFFHQSKKPILMENFKFDISTVLSQPQLTEDDRNEIIDYFTMHHWKVDNASEILEALVKKDELNLCAALLQHHIRLNIPSHLLEAKFAWSAPTPHGSASVAYMKEMENIEAYMRTLCKNERLITLLTQQHDPSLTKRVCNFVASLF